MKDFLYKYFWPIEKLKDCSMGSGIQRFKNYEYNKKHIHVLVDPILNFIICSQFSYFLIVFFEYLGKGEIYFIYLAAISAIIMVFCMIGAILLFISYIFLKNLDPELSKYLNSKI